MDDENVQLLSEVSSMTSNEFHSALDADDVEKALRDYVAGYGGPREALLRERAGAVCRLAILRFARRRITARKTVETQSNYGD